MLNKDEMDFVVELIRLERRDEALGMTATWSSKFLEAYYQKAILTEIKNDNPETN